MVRVLAIETSGRIGSVALQNGPGLPLVQEFPHGLQHAAQIIPLIDALLRQANLKPTDIDHLYLSAGPGSFTGLRIAITLAKTMAFANPSLRVVAVPTLRVLAENAPPEATQVLCILDAKRDQVFAARYQRSPAGQWLEQEPAQLDSLSALLARAPRPLWLVGEGIPYHAKFIPADAQIIITPESTWRGQAKVVADLGAQLAAQSNYADPMTLSPIYIRAPEAEEKWALLHPAPAAP